MTAWRTARLGEVAEVFNGKTPSKAEQRSSGHPVLKIKDVTQYGQFKGTFDSFVDPELAVSHEHRWVRAGDILLLNAAHNADYVASKMYFADTSVQGALPTGEWLIVRPAERIVLPGYVSYLLRCSEIKKAVKFLVKGIHLYPKDVAKLEIPLPSLDEQHRIIDFLSLAEGIVRLRREAQKKAAEIIPALFLDMFGNPATNPKGWPIERLGDIANVVSGITKGRKLNGKPTKSIPYLRVANVQAGFLNLNEMKEIEATDTEINALKLQTGDIVLTEGGDYDKLGRGAQWHGEIEACIHQNHIFRVRLRSDVAAPDYFEAYLQMAAARSYFLSVAKRTTNLASINMTQLRNLPVVLPTIESQRAFAQRIGQVRSILLQGSTATHAAEATFSALLAKVFSDIPNSLIAGSRDASRLAS